MQRALRRAGAAQSTAVLCEAAGQARAQVAEDFAWRARGCEGIQLLSQDIALIRTLWFFPLGARYNTC